MLRKSAPDYSVPSAYSLISDSLPIGVESEEDEEEESEEEV